MTTKHLKHQRSPEERKLVTGGTGSENGPCWAPGRLQEALAPRRGHLLLWGCPGHLLARPARRASPLRSVDRMGPTRHRCRASTHGNLRPWTPAPRAVAPLTVSPSPRGRNECASSERRNGNAPRVVGVGCKQTLETVAPTSLICPFGRQ